MLYKKIKFTTLANSEIKDKYFYRTEEWDWMDSEHIYVIDSKSPRMITMDYWPQQIFLSAEGNQTVSDFIYTIASKYAKTQIPNNLDIAIIDELNRLVHKEKIIAVSEFPIELNSNLLKPKTEEGTAEMTGNWEGYYTYDLPEEFKDEKTTQVHFQIKIDKVESFHFIGKVEDNLKTGGTPGVGDIEGDWDNNSVSFEKRMPISASIDEQGNHILDESKKHASIIYFGEFSRDKKTISGKWRFKKKQTFWKGIIPFRVYPGWGEFTMTKKEA